MEQSPSSLSVQLREQKDEYPTLVLVQNILRPVWRWFLCLALLSQLWGFCCCPGEAAVALGAFQGELGLSQLPAQAAGVPSTKGKIPKSHYWVPFLP